MTRSFYLIATLVIMVLLIPAPALAAGGPIFTPASCMFKVPSNAVEGRNVICGYVTVPEQHADPLGRTIDLAVAIIKSPQSNIQPDPLFMAQGGPGGSTIDTYAERLLTDSRLLTNRDIVLWDQRGTMYSKPNLYCSEYDQLTADTIEKVLSKDQSKTLEQQTVAACRQRLAGEGIDLSAFDSLENAADISDIRQALGYEKINLYGVSYGTLLAQHYMRQFPDSLRSVILDGVVPPQTNFNLNGAQTMNRSFEELFKACQKDLSCNKAYPDLEKVFYETVDKLNKTPARISLTDSNATPPVTYQHAVIDGDTFMSGIFQMLYAGAIIPALPRVIFEAHQGKFDFFGRIFSQLVFDRSMSYGMYYSVFCSEDGVFKPEDQNLNNLPPEIVAAEKDTPAQLLEDCRIWQVTPLGPSANQPVISDIPTLLLSGQFDPVTPPPYAQAVAANLSHSQSVVFPTGGHGQAMEGTCEDGMINAFLAAPQTPVDTSCIQKQTQVAFITPARVIDIPGMLAVLNLEGSTGIEMSLLFGALFVLGSSLLVVPLAWLVTRLRRPKASLASYSEGSQPNPDSLPSSVSDPFQEHPLADSPEGAEATISIEPSAISRFFATFRWSAGLLAVLAFLSLGVFLFAVIYVLVQMISANDMRLYYGIGGEARLWFVIPPSFALLSLGMLLATFLAWMRRYWSLGMRLYYSFLTLAALGALFVLIRWGLLFAFI
jgi:pimeloyl-ACP methyl ester carboxylesterase